MSQEASHDEIEWFHDLAKLPVEELVQQATDHNRTRFKKFVTASLPDHVPPDNQSPAEFATTVLELRANQRGWNRALGEALIHADDQRSEGNLQAAISALRSFANSCPWKAFGDFAHAQADNLGKDRN
ncbi:hypothetical protein ACGLHS_07515 [Variovorax sp. VaC1]|uniref:hypothetical protein n=1 Tax=Variovorax sp. VaC1 TaxID=3373132 RepID=UPI0037489065